MQHVLLTFSTAASQLTAGYKTLQQVWGEITSSWWLPWQEVKILKYLLLKKHWSDLNEICCECCFNGSLQRIQNTILNEGTIWPPEGIFRYMYK